LIIEEFGGFKLFQNLLQTLDSVARKHNAGIADVAANYVLQQKAVAAVIIGARNSKHLQNLRKLSKLELNTKEIEHIRAAINRGSDVPGDVYDIERDRHGKHGRIMKYNLNDPDS
jgi:aryl-alcohol dehydrogenase-like predicted oxidoreductase